MLNEVTPNFISQPLFNVNLPLIMFQYLPFVYFFMFLQCKELPPLRVLKRQFLENGW